MVEEGTARTIRTWIESSSRVAVLTHTNPDGDAIGSSLALALCPEEDGNGCAGGDSRWLT